MRQPGSDGEHKLQERYATAPRAHAFYEKQMLDRLNDAMREFISRQEIVFIATADSRGECDCSARVGPPGFVRVLDETTLIVPEYRGNGVMASLGNISENAHIGMIFVDFLDTTVGLHVNGRAAIVEAEELLGMLRRSGLTDLSEAIIEDIQTAGGRKPERWIRVEVEEAYIQCSKHIPLLMKADKQIQWGTDDETAKGSDYFTTQKSSKPA